MICKVEEEAKYGYYTMAFLRGVDRVRYGKPLEELDNNCVKGIESYPKTVSGAYSILSNYMQYTSYTYTGGGGRVAFTSVVEAIHNTNDLFHPKMPPTLPFSGMYQKQFIYRSKSTDSQ